MKTPTLQLNTHIVHKNIRKMKSFCREHQMDFRPHFKTHQSIEIAKWLMEEGIDKCTVSSVGMAKYFANAGWKDICIAIPININELEEVELLAASTKLSICVDHKEHLKALKSLKSHLSVFVEIDSTYGRSGVFYQNTDQIDELLWELEQNEQLEFAGFLSHTGNSYGSLNPEAGSHIFEEARQHLVQLKENYLKPYPSIILSMGDTPSSAFGKDFTGIDEWRPGNFIFYDFMQFALGACKEEDIAVSLFCPVIGVYPNRKEIVIYGGGVHLSKDSIEYKNQKIYGWLRPKNKGIEEGFPLVSLSQEHGIIQVSQEFLSSVKPGDFVEIIPIHSCMTADLNATYLTTEGQRIDKYRTF